MIILISQVDKEEYYLLESERARRPNRPITLRYWNVFNSFFAVYVFITYLLNCYWPIKKINDIRTANIMEISDITVESL